MTIATISAGIVCQFIQSTDPKHPLTYYTVDTAILLVAALLLADLLPKQRWLDNVRGAATCGSVLSGIVFAAVIAPSTETGTWIQPHDDAWVSAANIILHGIGPVLAVADFIISAQRVRRGALATALRWCLWPLGYFAVILPLDLAGVAPIPYEFLSVRESGPTLVIGAVAALFVVVILIGLGLTLLRRVARRERTPRL